ncbi:MAG: hypothetical protein RQ745_04335, partial [Longimicrobiales bacterium]|nr:hypothetical protein [Longimicrobiales bacterium]
MRSGSRTTLAPLAVGMSLILASAITAQPALSQAEGTPKFRASVHGGTSEFDLSGTGSASTLAFRGAFQANSVISFEASVG